MPGMEVLFFVICLAATVFFSAAETAITSVSLSAWDRLRQERADMARAYTLWSTEPSLVMAAMLFGNTLVSLGAGILANIFLEPLSAKLHWRPSIVILLSSFVVGAFILIVGEILPKLYARHYQERVLLKTAVPLTRLAEALRPLLNGLAKTSEGIQRLFSRRAPEPLITVEELRQALSETHGDGLGPVTRTMLSNIMAFDRVRVSEVMIPRAHVVGLRLEQNTERMFTAIIRSGFSRLPVYFGNIDNLLGIVYAKDLLVEWRSSGLLVLEDLLRPPYRIAPDAPLSVLLQGFRQGHHLAVVTDSLGRTQGIVTIEDAVEAIVGDIADEFDQPAGTF
jgi:putative hemolysin